MSPSIVALIPARAGSKRIPGKNTRDFFGHPLIWWTIRAAQESGIFQDVRVCTENYGITQWCFENANVKVIKRSDGSAADNAADIEWVFECLPDSDAFAILRPTSPFRTGETIRRAWTEFQQKQPCDSLRAVERARQHPLKMWVCGYRHGEMKPLIQRWPWPDGPEEEPGYTHFHSRPTQTLPHVYVQNASLEIAWTATVKTRGSISGDRVMPFLTEGYEGFDLNTEDDWQQATRLVRDGLVALPTLAPLSPTPAP
jgi:CMP-N,N'-diacetyllegionaminic acid synthase